ncbi:MAG: chorismate-binding protein [Akkermansiaceae bacterium]|nr:chorismate-binding protein [Akkermansiaceae bacterium]MBJ7424305.1 chorismate-binding protein [Akkermansiaceae bacterium]
MEKKSDSIAWLAKQDGTVVMGYGPFAASAEPCPADVSFYVQNFGLEDPLPWKTPSRIERTTTLKLASQIRNFIPLECKWSPLDAARFAEVFQEIMNSINGGILEKTVPVVTEIAKTLGSPREAILEAMIRQAHPLYSYGWLGPGSGFAGATPELLFALRGKHLETMALAGTARSEDRDVFAVDEKEIREHEYVAQALVDKMLDLGSVHRCSRKILDLGSIVHFLTTFQMDLESTHAPESLIRRFHPTPALGPLPRTDQTMALLLEWRQRLGCPAEFGAPFGLWDQGEFHAVVAIRGVWWKKQELKLPAGCGIIEASRLVNEWRELRLKRESVKSFLSPG